MWLFTKCIFFFDLYADCRIPTKRRYRLVVRDLKIRGREGWSRCVAKNKMLKMCLFAKDGDVNNSNFVKAIHISNDIL